MQPKTTKNKWIFLSDIASDALRIKLEQMALQGWKLKKTAFLYEFERIEPTTLHYSINFFPKTSQSMDHQYNPTLNYIQAYQQAGWELVGNDGIKHIFVTEQTIPEPTTVDDKQKFKILNDSIVWPLINKLFILLIWMAYSISSLSSNYFEYWVTSNSKLILFILLLLDLVYIIIASIEYLGWVSMNYSTFRSGGKLKYISNNVENVITIINGILFLSGIMIVSIISLMANDYSMIVGGLLLVGGVLVLVASIKTIQRIMKKSDNPGLFLSIVFISVMILLVFAQTYLPKEWFTPTNSYHQTLRITDFTDQVQVDNLDYFYYKSVIASYEYTSFSNKELHIRYFIFTSTFDFLIDKYCDNRLDSYQQIAPGDWTAEKVYINQQGHWLIIYDNLVFEIENVESLTQQQIHALENKILR